jgi:hypothetical protein
MAPSYRLINYSLRPAKFVERKMIFECLRRLSHFATVESYHYIGFGSLYFADIRLAHKSLGIRDLTSIERDSASKARFEFNRPYRCVKILYGESNVHLPTMDWKRPSIVWLDYDGKLDPGVLTDIRTFVTEAASGSIIVVSVNVESGFNASQLEQLSKTIGAEKLPGDLTEKDFRGWGEAAITRRILNNEVQEHLATRNGPFEEKDRYHYRQLFNFRYADDAKMLTIGGVLFSHEDAPKIERCGFSDFEYVQDGDAACEIRVPKLTHKEIRHLDQQLPKVKPPKVKKIDAPGIPDDDVERYASVYRYFPTFAEAEF